MHFNFVFNLMFLLKKKQRLGTNEDLLVEVLATRTNQEIRDLKRVYQEGYFVYSFLFTSQECT